MKNLQSNKQTNLALFLRLSKLFLPHWKLISAGVFLSLITVLASVSLLSLSSWFLASMAVAGVAKTTMNYFTPSAGIRMFALTRAVSRYLERLINHNATLKILVDLRVWFYRKIEPLAPAVLQKYHSADIFSRIKADIDTLENVYVRIIVPTLTALIAGGLFVYFASLYSAKLALIEALGLSLGGFIIPFILLKLSQKSGREIIKTSAKLREYTLDNIQGLGELLVYGAIDRQTKKIDEQSKKLAKLQEKMALYNSLSQAFLMIVIGVSVVLSLAIVIPLVEQESMPAVNVAMLAIFVLGSFEAVSGMSQAFNLLPQTLMAGRRVFELIDAKPTVVEPKNPIKKIDSFDLAFKSVTFSYEDRVVLQNFSFELKEGEKIAIVGRSGKGKSTIVNLIARFYDFASGEITIGKHSIREYESDFLREHISIATQENQIFNKTIRDNLLLAKENATDTELKEVCQAAQIYDYISSLPNGFDTWMDELGSNFSGGQKRRLVVARALLKPAKILILDEPAEGLDKDGEKRMLREIFDYKKSTSILVISHSKIEGIRELII